VASVRFFLRRHGKHDALIIKRLGEGFLICPHGKRRFVGAEIITLLRMILVFDPGPCFPDFGGDAMQMVGLFIAGNVDSGLREPVR